MALASGTLLRMYPNTGTVGTPIYTAIGCEVDSTISGATDVTDTTCKDSNGWKTHAPTNKSASISASGYADAGDAALDKLLNNWQSGTQTLFEYKTFNSEKYTGNSTITSFELSAAQDGMVNFSVTLEVDGALSIAAIA